MGKGRFALQSRLNDFHTNSALNFFFADWQSENYHPCIFTLAYLTLGKNRNVGSIFGA